MESQSESETKKMESKSERRKRKMESRSEGQKKQKLESEGENRTGEMSEVESEGENRTGEMSKVESEGENRTGEMSEVESERENRRGEMSEVESEGQNRRGKMSEVESEGENRTGEMSEVKSEGENRRGDMSEVESEGQNRMGEMSGVEIDDVKLRADCEEAARQGQWDVVITLLGDGVCPGDQVLTRMFNNMTPQLINRLSFNKLHSTVLAHVLKYAVLSMPTTGTLEILECAWRSMPETMIIELIQPENVSSYQLNTIVTSALNHRKMNFLKELFTSYPRCSRDFRQYLSMGVDILLQGHEDHIDNIFYCLYAEGPHGTWYTVPMRMKHGTFRQIIMSFTQLDQECGLLPFVRLCSDCLGAVLPSTKLKDDWQFACVQAVKADRCQYIWDTISFENATGIRCVRKGANMLKVVLNMVVTGADQHEKLAPALDAWMTNSPKEIGFCLPMLILHRYFWNEADVIEADAMASSVQWCLHRSYNSLAVAIAIFRQDWDMVVHILTTLKYKSQFSETLLKNGKMDGKFTLLLSEERRLKLADRCQAAGLTLWAIYFAYSDLNRMLSLVNDTSDPDCVEYAFTKAACHEEWQVFEHLADICTHPDGVVAKLLKTYGAAWCFRRWSSAEKLVCRCTDSDLIFDLLCIAVSMCDPDIVKSLVQMINMNKYGEHSSKYLGICDALNFLLVGLYDTPQKVLKIVRLFVKAGIFKLVKYDPITNKRSGVLITYFDNLHNSVPSGDGQLLVEVTKLLIESGAIPNRTLDAMRREPQLQQALEVVTTELLDEQLNSDLLLQSTSARTRAPDARGYPVLPRKKSYKEFWKDSYTAVVKAAANPGSLQSLARQAVSKALGCQLDRTAKIDSLPVPHKAKDYIDFKDLTN